MANGLMVHSGGNKIQVEELAKIPTPPATATWFPIPHKDIYALCVDNLTRMGYSVKREEHAIAHEGNRWFGVLDLSYAGAPADYTLVAGLRNSHDKSFPAGLCVGSKVFVCDNLAFSSEINLARKHTRYIMRDLPRIVGDAMGKLGGMRIAQEKRIDAYKTRDVSDTEAHDFLVRALDMKVIGCQALPHIVNEWRKPRHLDFMPRNAWSLFNAFTEILKAISPTELPNRTIGLHGMMDALCNLKTVEGAALN